jgi:hypothetical protein
MKKRQIKLNRPIIAALQILELSKLMMYRFCYETLETAYSRQHLRILLTDTDSFVFELKTTEPNPFVSLSKIQHVLETSSFPPDHLLYRSIADKEKLGLMQIETGHNKIITEFFGCRAKSYFLDMYDIERKTQSSMKRIKGVTKATQKQVEMSHFRDCIFDKTILRADQRTIRSYNTMIYTIKTRKMVLNSLDFKRYVLDDGITTLPFGHYSINQRK